MQRFARPDRATGGPQEGHHDELGRPSRVISRPVMGSGTMRQMRIKITDWNGFIYCDDCSKQLNSFSDLFFHVCDE